MSAALNARIASGIAAPMAQPVRDQAERLGRAAGAVAVLFYGSNLRTGSLEGVLDYYVLLPGAVERGIWPRVSYHEWDAGGQGLRAKVATMNIGTFQAAASGQLVDTTIWARFVQPSALAWGADENAHRQVVEALSAAAMTAARLAAALGPSSGVPDAFWRALFRATYRAEFRVEAAGREDSILTANQTHFEGLLPLALEAGGIAFTQQAGEITPQLGPGEAQRIRRWWARRRRLGKPYNLLRLIRASTTFEGAARYAAWKIERHTGVAVTLTPWRERHPLLAAPGVLWQVWRARKRAR